VTAPAQTTEQPRQLTAAQMAALLALVQAQAAVRQQLAQAAGVAATAAIAGFTAWWDADAITEMIAKVLRVVQPIQRNAATITDGYITRAATIISGRSQRAAGVVDIRRLRRAMTEELADELLAGVRQAVRVELGRLLDRPSTTVEDSPAWGLEDDRQAQDPAEPYGRVADGYRWSTTMLGNSPEQAQAKAAVRIAAIAETDVTLAVRAQYQKTMSAQGAIGWRRILHPELSRSGPCGLCVVAADRVYKSEDLLPIHNRCVPAGTRVAAEGVRALTRRRYSGALVVLGTASGQELTITAKHPVLTDRGWVPAHLVQEGDRVVRHRSGHGVVGRGPHEQDVPPLVEDVWRAAVVSGALRRSGMPVAAQDFHGDGSYGEVDAVSTYGLLPNIGDVSFAKPRGELGLMVGHRRGAGFAGASSPFMSFLGDRPSPTSFVGELDLGEPICGRHARMVGAQSFGDAANRNFRFLQAKTDRVAVKAVLRRQRKLGRSLDVLLDNIRVRGLLPGSAYFNASRLELAAQGRQPNAHLGGDHLRGFSGEVEIDGLVDEIGVEPPQTRFDPAGFEFLEDGRDTYAQLGGDLLGRLAGNVELDRVVSYRRFEGTHEVFNLHTDEGWYSANGLIVSNCVCEVLPVYQGADPGLTLNGDDLAAVYEAAGGNTREQLRRISVVLTEHGELGPILVDGNQHYRSPEEVARNYASSRAVRERAILEGLEERYQVTQLRILRGDPLEKTLKSQQARIEQLRASLAS